MSITQIANKYLNPFYHKPVQYNVNYKFCAWSHLTKAASNIKNQPLRYIAEFFAMLFDSTIGGGIIGSLLYNPSVFIYNQTIARYKNVKTAQENAKKWNATALKTYGITVGTASALTLGSLYYFGICNFGIDAAVDKIKGLF